MDLEQKLKWFIEAWEWRGVGDIVASIQDSPSSSVVLELQDLKDIQDILKEKSKLKAVDMKIGGKYNWQHQVERLAYMGKKGLWFQFEKVDSPGRVWCEVLESDLEHFEVSKWA